MSDPTAGLTEYARDVHSQNGEDGILERIFALLGVERGWCVEFGAWDGVHLSNTRHLIQEHGWNAVLIEANPEKFAELHENSRPFAHVTCVERFVTFDPPDHLDGILAQAGVPEDLDLLSIDVDGCDYHIWESMQTHRPKIVVIEINPTMPNHVEFVQARDMAVQHGSSLRAMAGLGRQKGYELAAVTTSNGIFAREDVFPELGVMDNSLETLRPGREHETSLLHLFDGTLALAGRTHHPWNGIELRDARLQILPRPLRVYSPDASPRVRRMQKLWAWLYRHRP